MELPALVGANDAVVCCTRVTGGRDAVHAVVRQILGDAICAAPHPIGATIGAVRANVLPDVRNFVPRAFPGELDIAHTRNGKPYLADPSSALKFNLSHCGDVLMVALSLTAEVGVDLERVRAIPEWRRIADRVFDPATRERLFSEIACGADEDDTFLRDWCRMEASVKATGEGVFGRHASDTRVIDLPDLPLPAGDARYRAALALCP